MNKATFMVTFFCNDHDSVRLSKVLNMSGVNIRIDIVADIDSCNNIIIIILYNAWLRINAEAVVHINTIFS